MTQFIEKFADSKFIHWLQELSIKMSKNDVFSTLSSGMGGTMGLIMIGAVIQIICAIGSLVAGWQAGDPVYDIIYMPYKLTMGMLGFFMCFSLDRKSVV